MTLYLYISYSQELSDQDRRIIDKKVYKNQKAIFRFIINTSSKVNKKTKIAIITAGIVLGAGSFNLEPANAVGVSRPALSIETMRRRQPSFETSFKNPANPQILEQISPKQDRISYESFYEFKDELLIFLYAFDINGTISPELFDKIKKCRGGDLSAGAVGLTVVTAAIIIGTAQAWLPILLQSSWGTRPHTTSQLPKELLFQPQTFNDGSNPFTETLYDLLNPRRTCPAMRPGGTQIMSPNGSRVRLQSSREDLTQVSTNRVPTQTQMSGFVKNEKVDLRKCLDEVNRRAAALNRTDFECSYERFKELATENGEITRTTAREAVSVLEGEIRGYYRNAARQNYGEILRGLTLLPKDWGNMTI